MNVGDLVMYTDGENYAEWFYGRLARVNTYSDCPNQFRAPELPEACPRGCTGHVRVEWCAGAVPYMNLRRGTTYSDFRCAAFEVIRAAG